MSGEHRARVLYAALQAAALDGVVDLVLGARTVLVACVSPAALAQVRTAVPGWQAALLDADGREPAGPVGEVVVIPVRYDGPDLDEVARTCGMTRDEVVRRHAAVVYDVAFSGFTAGFAYLSGLDHSLHVARRAAPRSVVPAGSVAVAGEYTAVYPRRSPGGWSLLGSTDTVMWDTDREPAALLLPGGRVRFVPAPA